MTARRDALSDLVQDWNPDQHAKLAAMLTRLARHLAEGPAPVPVGAARLIRLSATDAQLMVSWHPDSWQRDLSFP